MLRKALQGLGILDTMLYSAKTFRVGAAFMCYSLNMSTEDIQALRLWASLVFLYYIRAGAAPSCNSLLGASRCSHEPRVKHVLDVL